MVARPALAEEGPPPPPGETMWQPEAVEQSRESGKREANWTMWSEKQPRAKACTSQTQNPQNPDTAFPLSGLLMKHYKGHLLDESNTRIQHCRDFAYYLIISNI